jgi:hypothetical protein
MHNALQVVQCGLPAFHEITNRGCALLLRCPDYQRSETMSTFHLQYVANYQKSTTNDTLSTFTDPPRCIGLLKKITDHTFTPDFPGDVRTAIACYLLWGAFRVFLSLEPPMHRIQIQRTINELPQSNISTQIR